MARLVSIIIPVLLLAACACGRGESTESGPPGGLLEGIRDRGGRVLAQDAYGDSATNLVYLDQGWGPAETLWFYHADQGSVLMPYDTLIHLEQVDREAPLMSAEHLTKFRFLNQHPTPNNPDGLPIGFARHKDQVGLTCAACHTTQVNYQGTAIRIDGGPALADVPGFLRELEAALAATLADEAKLTRFAAARKGGGAGETAKAAARASVEETLAWFRSYNAVNHGTTTEGFGRMDAIGRIINQAIRFTSDAKNAHEPNAPASFPLLWDAPRHDYVQWIGFAGNSGAGSLGRNAGEVIGVFGKIDVVHYETEKEARRGYKSTIDSSALVSMEESLRKLQSPVWPEQVLPAIDGQLAARGAQLYQEQCASCHAVIDRDDPERRVTAMITGVDVVGTDPGSATFLAEARVPSGVLAGAISPKGERYGAEMTALSLLGDLVARTLATNPVAAARAIVNAKRHKLEETPKQGDYPRDDKDPAASLRAYKARPLNGIWAAAPYLHNGSVPTLHDLLLPVDQRPRKFAVGRWEYDPKKVGYVSDGEVPFVVDTAVVGNSNRGHEYGVTLAEADRWALVEYLKTL
ncbi:c-type cytochrome [Nannocystis radixulma]|uniref:Cytochrome c n=1 Tax=Nannocystis radixulma TaxID=2995305 RepID=A0ABT5AXD2_9BACT|nr:cytochrome c [Nannocystis radixulma]MDC0666504.1 cytochrome c [Nannocystis radixulma]